MNSGKPNTTSKAARKADGKAAMAEAEKEKRAVQKKTAKLRELRLAKEAEERAAEALKPKKPLKVRKKRGLPEFVRER